MKNKAVLIMAIALLATSFTSCKKKDKEAPTISISTPEEHSEHKGGERVHMNVTFEDDIALKSYVVMVGDESGSHDMDFDYMKSGDISGVSHSFHDHFDVPTNAKTMRWVHFTVTDAEDKITTKKWMLHFSE